jgi:hypothetical protein
MANALSIGAGARLAGVLLYHWSAAVAVGDVGPLAPTGADERQHEGMRIRLAQYPRFLLRLMDRPQFSRLFLNWLQHRANETCQRAYPGDFVAEIVPGDGKEFDWGLDFTEWNQDKLSPQML